MLGADSLRYSRFLLSIVIITLASGVEGGSSKKRSSLSEQPVRSLDGSELGGWYGGAPGMFKSIEPHDISFYDSLPSAREISNKLFDLPPTGEMPRRSSLFIFWAQSVAHDLSSTAVNNSEPLPVLVPRCDEQLDPGCLSGVDDNPQRTLSFFRAQHLINARTGTEREGERLSPLECLFCDDIFFVFKSPTFFSPSRSRDFFLKRRK